jgi:hypothetical protein
MNTRGIFVTERRSGSSFSEGRKPELRFGTLFRWHWYNYHHCSHAEFWVILCIPEPF